MGVSRQTPSSDSGLDSLIVALDGATQQNYEQYRQGGHIDRVLQAIRSLAGRRAVRDATHPFINVRTVVMKHNEREIPQLVEMTRDIGADALTLKTMNSYGDGEGLLPEDADFRRFQYSADGRTRLRRAHNPCKHLWNMPAIHWNGSICMCTYDSQEFYVMGNLRNRPGASLRWPGHRWPDRHGKPNLLCRLGIILLRIQPLDARHSGGIDG